MDLVCTEAGTWHALAVWHEATLDDEGTIVSNEASGSTPGTLQDTRQMRILFPP